MATITTRYMLGDEVWLLRTWRSKKRGTCGLCAGAGAATFGTSTRSINCPDCYGRGHVFTEEDQLSAEIRKLTIGYIRATITENSREIEYMCVETGIGSGSVWREDLLFLTRAAAEVEAEAKGARIEATP